MLFIQPGLKSGKLGDVTVSRNRAGQYLRKRGKQTNPKTPRQEAHRAIMTSLPGFYRTLKPEQFLAWDRFAEDKNFTDGYRAYVSVNETLVTLGDPITATPPPLAAFGIFNTTGPKALISGDAFFLSLEDAEDPTLNVRYIVEATPPGSAAPRKRDSDQTFIKAPATLDDLRDGAVLGRAYLAVYQAKHGLPVVGAGIVLRLTAVLNGQRKLPLRYHAIVAPAA